MSALLNQLKKVATDLNEFNVPWALVGALACSIYTQPRTTRDIDVSIACNDDTLEVLLRSLETRGYGKPSLLLHVHPTRRLGYRLGTPNEGSGSVPVDLLCSSSGIEPEIIQDAILVEVVPRVIVPIAAFHHILAMKILSENDGDRIQDRADVRQLIKRATPEEIESAQEALKLIELRGFNRNKNLLDELEADLRRYG